MGRLGADQVKDYQRRKGLELRQVERWLAPYLDYEPEGSEAPEPVATGS